MKTAYLSVLTFEARCPHCKCVCREPFWDSYKWVIGKVEAGDEFDCSECGQRYKLPVRVASHHLLK
jgi:hypothetical protein